MSIDNKIVDLRSLKDAGACFLQVACGYELYRLGDKRYLIDGERIYLTYMVNSPERSIGVEYK